MLVSGVGDVQSFAIEENTSVETVLAATAKNVPLFNRALRAEQEKRMESDKKVRDLRGSEEYRLLQQQSKNGTKHVVDTYL